MWVLCACADTTYDAESAPRGRVIIMVKFARNKNAILLGVAVVVIMWLVIPSLRHETVLVPVRSEVPRGKRYDEK